MEDRLMDENTEDYLEILYWEFDTEKKKGSFSERDLFKAKMRGLIRTIQNTRATDSLMGEMARALKYVDRCIVGPDVYGETTLTKDFNYRVIMEALQKWEAKNAKTTQEKD